MRILSPSEFRHTDLTRESNELIFEEFKSITLSYLKLELQVITFPSLPPVRNPPAFGKIAFTPFSWAICYFLFIFVPCQGYNFPSFPPVTRLDPTKVPQSIVVLLPLRFHPVPFFKSSLPFWKDMKLTSLTQQATTVLEVLSKTKPRTFAFGPPPWAISLGSPLFVFLPLLFHS